MSNRNTLLPSVSFRVDQVLFWVLAVTSEVKKQGSCFAPNLVPIFFCVCLCVFMFMCVCVWVSAHLPCTCMSMYMEVRGQLQLSFLRCVHFGYFSGLELAKWTRMATREPWGLSCFCFSSARITTTWHNAWLFFFSNGFWGLNSDLHFRKASVSLSCLLTPFFLPQFTLLGKLFTWLLGHHLGFDHGMSTSNTWLLLILSLPTVWSQIYDCSGKCHRSRDSVITLKIIPRSRVMQKTSGALALKAPMMSGDRFIWGPVMEHHLEVATNDSV